MGKSFLKKPRKYLFPLNKTPLPFFFFSELISPKYLILPTLFKVKNSSLLLFNPKTIFNIKGSFSFNSLILFK